MNNHLLIELNKKLDILMGKNKPETETDEMEAFKKSNWDALERIKQRKILKQIQKNNK